MKLSPRIRPVTWSTSRRRRWTNSAPQKMWQPMPQNRSFARRVRARVQPRSSRPQRSRMASSRTNAPTTNYFRWSPKNLFVMEILRRPRIKTSSLKSNFCRQFLSRSNCLPIGQCLFALLFMNVVSLVEINAYVNLFLFGCLIV